MIEIETLPHEPESAVQELIQRMLGIVPNGNGSLADLARAQPRSLTSLKLHLVTSRRVADRIEDETVRSAVKEALVFSDQQGYKSVRQALEDAYATITLTRLDDHFLPQDSINEFDRAVLDNEDKDEIRALMAKARKLTLAASFLGERNKRRINMHISKIEAELYKEVSGFSTFIAAATDVSGLLKQFGKDGKEIAEAIQIARTVTEKKLMDMCNSRRMRSPSDFQSRKGLTSFTIRHSRGEA